VSSGVVVTWPAYDVDGPATGALLTQAGYDVRLHPKTSNRTPAEVADLVGDAAAVIASTDPFDASVFAVCSNLKVIARTGVGVDSIDVHAATAAGVVVTTTPGANEEAVADHALALMLAVRRLLATNDAMVRSGRWERTGRHIPSDLYAATVGLIGCGAIGRAVIRRLTAFGSTILVADPNIDGGLDGARLVDLETLLGSCDIVSVHAPLNDSTQGMLGVEEFAMMRPGAMLVNVARGGIVVEAALADALQSGKLAGAGIDTFESEPPGDSPLVHAPNVVLSPHIAGISADSIRRMTVMATESVLDVLTGRRPKHCVNPEVFES
jgi:phosphoglycerate dehydrogenase-like enzyme